MVQSLFPLLLSSTRIAKKKKMNFKLFKRKEKKILKILETENAYDVYRSLKSTLQHFISL